MRDYRRFRYLVLLGFAVAAPFILNTIYYRELLIMSGIFAILALSLNVIMGYMGQFSFGHAAFFGIGAYTSALLSKELGWSVWLGFLAAIIVTAALGLLLAYVCLRRMRGVYLAIATFGFGTVAQAVAINWYSLTRGSSGLPGIPAPTIAIPGLPEIVFRSEISYYYLALLFVVFTIYLMARLLHSRFGRGLIALRENENLGMSIGIANFRYYVLAFALSTALAGLAGALYAHYRHFMCPDLLGLPYMFMMLIMVIVGGVGTLGGPVLGAVIFVFGSEWLRVAGEFRFIIFGVILLLCVIFMPQGVYPSLVSLWNRFIVWRGGAEKAGTGVK